MSSASGATTVPMSRPSATQSPLGDERALLVEQGGAHGGVGRPPRGLLGDLGRADRLADVLAVEQHAVALEADVQVARIARARQRHGAVERPGVQVGEAERPRDGAGDGRLAGPRGTVDGDEHGGCHDRTREAAAAAARARLRAAVDRHDRLAAGRWHLHRGRGVAGLRHRERPGGAVARRAGVDRRHDRLPAHRRHRQRPHGAPQGADRRRSRARARAGSRPACCRWPACSRSGISWSSPCSTGRARPSSARPSARWCPRSWRRATWSRPTRSSSSCARPSERLLGPGGGRVRRRGRRRRRRLPGRRGHLRRQRGVHLGAAACVRCRHPTPSARRAASCGEARHLRALAAVAVGHARGGLAEPAALPRAARGPAALRRAQRPRTPAPGATARSSRPPAPAPCSRRSSSASAGRPGAT